MSLNLYDLEQQIETKMKTGHVPGFAMAIVQNQKVIYARGFGYTAVENNRECGLPITPQTLFRIGSTTKALTGTAVMRLVEAGKLDLDTPIKAYIPWLTFGEAGAVDSVTLRMLMSHTSGLFSEDEYAGRRDPAGLEAYVREMIPQIPLVAPPGKAFSYSGPGMNLAGYIAEVVSSKNYTKLMQELVFDPLEMKHTTFDPMVAMTYSLAQSHYLSADGNLSIQHLYVDNVGQYPEGSANSTVLDLANFCMMQMNQGRFGNTQIISPASVAEMQRVQAHGYTLNDEEYGLTFFTSQYKGVRRVGHAGGMTSHFTILEMVPEFGVAIIAVGSRLSSEFISGEFINRILDQLLDLPAELPKPPVIEPDKSRWSQYSGSYLGNSKGLAIIQADDDQLVLNWHGDVIPLVALKDQQYYGQKPNSEEMVNVGFIDEESGAIQYILINGDLCTRFKSEIEAIPYDDAWKVYTGQYRGFIGILTIRMEGNQFVIHSNEFGGTWNLAHLGNARFASQFGIVEFQANQDGLIISLILMDLFTYNRI